MDVISMEEEKRVGKETEVTREARREVINEGGRESVCRLSVRCRLVVKCGYVGRESHYGLPTAHI